MIWHSSTIDDVLTELQVDPTVGLSSQDITDRLKEYGENRLQKQEPLSLGRAFIARLRSPLTILLLAVSAVVLILDLYKQVLREVTTNWHLSLIAAAMTMVAALLGALQHRRAVSLSDWMHTLAVNDARVRRNGTEQTCSALVLVPGDVVFLSAGSVVPADCRLITAEDLRCDERALIGATMPTEKDAAALFHDITPLAQRTNMVYAGTTVTAGTAVGVVVATGMRSEMGHGTQPQGSADLPTHGKAKRVNVYWAIAASAVGLVALLLGLAHVEDRSAVLLTAFAVALAATPTNMVALDTDLVSGNVQRLLRRHVRVCRPAAADTLGRVTVVGVEQDMLHQDGDVTLCRAFVGHRTVDLTTDTPNAPGLGQLMRLAALNTEGSHDTDTAILTRLPKLGIDKNELLLDMPRIGELPSTSERKTSVHLAGDRTLVLVSGEWRTLLPLCTKGNAEELTAAATDMEREGLQVTAITYRLDDTAPSVYTAEALEQDLTCAGLLAFSIPLCAHVSQTDAGVRTLLFSNDSAAVAAAAAKRSRLIDTPYAAVGETIQRLTDAELAKTVQHYNVYCGLDTAQKQRVLTALQQQGEVAAITVSRGEDVGLLTAADVGCARGTVTTDTVKAAADLILAEDSPAAVFTAIQAGRRLRWEKAALLLYLLIASVGIIFVGFGGLCGLFSPTYCAPLILGLHLILFALPTPLWITRGISNVVKKR